MSKLSSEEEAVKVGIYARVSTDAQEARGTIGSQLDTLRARVAAEGDELVGEFIDDGYSGARLDRPGLDALRDAAEAGIIDVVWCLSPDRLARSYAYQILILEELARFDVAVRFADAPPLDDPQGRLLVQIQGVIAEHERAKFAERGRRGKLYRSRSGEVLSTKVPYGYRRVAAWSGRPGPCGHLRTRSGRRATRLLGLPGRSQPAAPRGRALQRRDRLARGQGGVAAVHHLPAAPQRGLRRSAVLEPHPHPLRPCPGPEPPNSAATRGVDRDTHPGHHRRRHLRRSRDQST